MKKLTPLALCITMFATGPALALDTPSASTPEVKSTSTQQVNTVQSEVKTETEKTPATTDTATDSKDTTKTETGLNQDTPSQTPATPGLENQTSQDKLPTGQSEQPLSGQEANTTGAPGNNVQKLFSMFHPKQQADAPQQETPASTPTTQTQQ